MDEIKLDSKQKLQDYKARVRHLTEEVEELEMDRTRLRYKLRTMS